MLRNYTMSHSVHHHVHCRDFRKCKSFLTLLNAKIAWLWLGYGYRRVTKIIVWFKKMKVVLDESDLPLITGLLYCDAPLTSNLN